MNDTRARLSKCFAAVFPDLTEEDIVRASISSVGGWDSLASVTLLSALEEEFALQIDPEELEHLVSFDLILDYLQHEHQLS
jgi:acyl carrier protein